MSNCRGCFFVALALLLVPLLIVGFSVLRVGHFLASVDVLTPADAVVILGGNIDRVQHAIRLHQDGYAPTVVFSGGQLKDVGLACSSAQLSLEAARELGLPAGAAIIAGEAQSTYDDAINLAQLAGRHGWRSLIVVTSPFHARRAGRTFRALLPGIQIRVSAAPDPDSEPGRWWETEQGLVAVVTEILKLGFYWVQYGISPF